MSESRIAEARQILAHFYDHIYLGQHPLVRRCRGALGDDTSVAVQKLRRTLLQIIESLRPSEQVGSDDAMWRPYMVLHHRYILGKDMQAVEQELGLGARQIQREQRRGLEAVVKALAERLDDREEPDGAHPPDALSSEVLLVASEQELFDFGEQLDRALLAVDALAEAHGVAFHQERDPDSPRVFGSPSALKQLLVLLLSHIVRSGISRAFVVRLRGDGGEVRCSFIATAQPAGADGLSSLTLPPAVLALAAAQQAEILVEPPTPGGRGSLDLVVRGSRRCHTVLLVEDNADVVALFARYLMPEGFQCIPVTDSTMAHEQVVAQRPDAVILDVMMRKMDGWELLQRLKADPSLRRIPVVVCSVLDERELANSLGADAYLRKPVRPAELIECLLGLCR